MKVFGLKVYKTPLQIQLFTTARCNRKCEWCIERENMLRSYNDLQNQFLANLRKVVDELNKKEIPYNVVITGGEPTVNESLVREILNLCDKTMPKVALCRSSDSKRPTRAFKVGINSNGDNPASPIYGHPRLDYIDISFIDTMRGAKNYSSDKRVRLQSVCRKSIFSTTESVIHFIDLAVDNGYESVLFRQMVGDHLDKKNVFELEREIAEMKAFAFQDYQVNVYDLWVRYLYRNRSIYFKRQDLDAQRVFERINRQNISSLVFWPNGTITKSWDFSNQLVI